MDYSHSRFGACLIIHGLLSAAAVADDLVPSLYLPLTEFQRLASEGFIYGSSCTTDGTYDAITFVWSQLGVCTSASLFINSVSVAEPLAIDATLDAQVDNGGVVIGGAFSMYGTIPDLGINERSLLAAGTLIDAHSGLAAPSYPNLMALVDLDFTVPGLSGLGSLLYWETNSEVGQWFVDNSHWQTSVTGYSGNFTGSQYFFYARSTIISAVADIDSDGVTDEMDNCVLAANADQRDADGDGIGSVCDTDLNNDCVTSVADLGLLRTLFFSNNANADFNGDGVVNFVDLGLMRSGFLRPPGPSGLPNLCDSPL